ncbi:MAG: hypothetical protein WBQ74_09335 [Candidatus Sulfotelmatobacter sp.]|jgi:hypothetical protein
MSITAALPETGSSLNPSNSAPPRFDPKTDLPGGFWNFFLPLHQIFTPRQQELAVRRAEVLQSAVDGNKPCAMAGRSHCRPGARTSETR